MITQNMTSSMIWYLNFGPVVDIRLWEVFIFCNILSPILFSFCLWCILFYASMSSPKFGLKTIKVLAFFTLFLILSTWRFDDHDAFVLCWVIQEGETWVFMILRISKWMGEVILPVPHLLVCMIYVQLQNHQCLPWQSNILMQFT